MSPPPAQLEHRVWEGGNEAEGSRCRVRLAFTFADLLVVCSFLFVCRTWLGAHVNPVSDTEPSRHAGGLDNVSTFWLLPTPSPRGRSSSKGAWVCQACVYTWQVSISHPRQAQDGPLSPDTLHRVQGLPHVTSDTVWGQPPHGMGQEELSLGTNCILDLESR